MIESVEKSQEMNLPNLSALSCPSRGVALTFLTESKTTVGRSNTWQMNSVHFIILSKVLEKKNHIMML